MAHPLTTSTEQDGRTPHHRTAGRVTGRGRVYAWLTVSPKNKPELAREHLEAARSASEDERMNDAVNALFYAGEAAIVALAEHHGIDTKKHHGLKADAASQLYTEGALAKDYGPLLRTLNQARKDIWYEGEEPELDDDLESIVAEVETLVEAAEACE